MLGSKAIINCAQRARHAQHRRVRIEAVEHKTLGLVRNLGSEWWRSEKQLRTQGSIRFFSIETASSSSSLRGNRSPFYGGFCDQKKFQTQFSTPKSCPELSPVRDIQHQHFLPLRLWGTAQKMRAMHDIVCSAQTAMRQARHACLCTARPTKVAPCVLLLMLEIASCGAPSTDATTYGSEPIGKVRW